MPRVSHSLSQYSHQLLALIPLTPGPHSQPREQKERKTSLAIHQSCPFLSENTFVHSSLVCKVATLPSVDKSESSRNHSSILGEGPWDITWPFGEFLNKTMEHSKVILQPSLFKNVFIFNWRIIALQYCVGFYQISTWISHRLTMSPHRLEHPSHLLPLLIRQQRPEAMLAGPPRAAVTSQYLKTQGRHWSHHLDLLVKRMYYGFPHPLGNCSRAETISPAHSNHF